MGDPDYVRVPVEGLTSKEYAAELAKTISLDKITPSVSAGDPFKYQAGDDPGLKATDLTCKGKRDHIMGSGCTITFRS